MAPDGWEKWSKFVVKELERLGDAYEKLADKTGDQISELKAEIAMLKIKSGVYGLVGGAILLLIFILSRYVGG